MTSRGDRLVEEYLRRLDNASVFLGEERRAELRQEIVEHIAAGTEEAEAVHAEAVRAVLDRLGPPADIVASETGSGSGPGPGSAGPGPVAALGQDAPHVPGSVTKGDDGPPRGSGSAGVLRGRSRKFALVLAGAVVAAVAVGTMAIGASSSSSVPSQRSNEPSTAPSQSDTPTSEPSAGETTTSEPPSESPETDDTSSAPPSPDTSTPQPRKPSVTPTATE